MSTSIRLILVVMAISKFSVCGAQEFDQTPIYEALFAQVDRLGMDKTYYIAERESRPPRIFNIEAGFRIPVEIATHTAEKFGSVNVSLVDESFLDGLWGPSCIEGWNSFHRRYPDAGDLTQVSQVAFNDLGDEARVFISLGRGCQNAWFATYHLQKQEGRWVVTGRSNGGAA